MDYKEKWAAYGRELRRKMAPWLIGLGVTIIMLHLIRLVWRPDRSAFGIASDICGIAVGTLAIIQGARYYRRYGRQSPTGASGKPI